MSPLRADAGFSLVELAVALVLALAVAGAALAIMAPASTTGRTEPEVVDLQQRARVGQDLLTRDLYMAGAGIDLGPATGPLQRFLPPIVPRRMGLQNADAFSVARSDAITILFVPQTFSQTTLRDPLPPGADLRVDQLPNCPPVGALCGLSAGSAVLVFDREGHFDAFTLTQVGVDTGVLRPWQAGHPPYSYAAGSVISGVEWHTYYLDLQNRQLRHSDGYLTDIPVVDDVVGLAVEYFGAPEPPVPGLGVLPAQGASLAPLPLSLFADGPWYGDGDNRYDADLLRVRMVRVTLRLQVGNDDVARAVIGLRRRGQEPERRAEPAGLRASIRRIAAQHGMEPLMVLVALAATVLLNAIGLGLLSLANTEAVIASNYRQANQLLYAAEAAADCALADLGGPASWTSVLSGTSTSSFRDTTLTPVLASGERIDLTAMTSALQSASDAAARRGANNPRWRLFVYEPLSRIVRSAHAADYVVAWVADDAAETDDDPLTDGNDIVTIRAQALGPQGLQRAVEVTVVKEAIGVSLLSWREVR